MSTLLLACLSLVGGTEAPKSPRAVAFAADGRLFVATREGRSLIEVDPKTWRVVAERPVGAELVSLAPADGGRLLLAGSRDGELLALDPDGKIRRRAKLGRGPARAVDLGGGKILFTSLWSREALAYDVGRGVVLARHALGFEPGRTVVVEGGRVLVADAFSGRLALIDPLRPRAADPIPFDGVGIGGLATTDGGRSIFLANFSPFGAMPITRSNIDWGLVLSSKLTTTTVGALEHASASEFPARRRIALDGSRNGAANPGAIAATPDGRRLVIVASGANHLLIQDRDEGGPGPDDGLPRLGNAQKTRAVPTGRNPVDVAIAPDGVLAVTADAMDDSLTVVDVVKREKVAEVRLGPGAAAGSAALRGEALFHDGRRSMDRWMSCATCHPGGHTAGARFDTLGDGDHGAAKDTPTLLGVGATAPYSWTARFATLEQQVEQSFASSMQGEPPTAEDVADVVAFLRSTPPPPPIREPSDPEAERGRAVFVARKCESCHKPPSLAGAGRFDVGLRDENGARRFNPPSLRGVGRTAPYFHDGRAADLRSVVSKHSPAAARAMAEDEIRSLVAYLESL